jgi:hypothetical protein
MRKDYAIYFGPISLSFASPTAAIMRQLEILFSGYEINNTADFFIKINTSNELQLPAIQSHQKISISFFRNKSYFDLGPGFIKGTFNLKQQECAISVHPNFFPSLIEVFQAFLYRLYHTICFHRSIKSNIIHGCGVIKQDTGYLFIGPHQAGKTTIGKLLDGLILHDDQIIMTFHGKEISMNSPPLPGKYRHCLKTSYPVKTILRVVQNRKTSHKRLNTQYALKTLYDEIVLPLTLNSSDEKKARLWKSRTCFEIIKRLPIYELRFDEHRKFMELLRSKL